MVGVSFVAIIISCDPIDKRLTISNDSDEILFYITSASATLDGRSPFKNSFKIENGDTIWDESSNIIFPSSSKSPAIIGRNGWEDFINEDCEDSKLRIFVFEKNLIDRVPWDTIVTRQYFSKKYEFNVQDLEKLNWRVEYK